MRASGEPCGPADGGVRRERGSPWLLLLAFFAEDELTAVLDALALVGLRLAPAANLGGNLPDLLLVDAADLNRLRGGSLVIDAFGYGRVIVVALAELQG